jgi:hypothetical protein
VFEKKMMEKVLGLWKDEGRLRRRWEDNIKMAVMEMRWEDWTWMKLAQIHVQWQVLVFAELNLQLLLP